MEHPTLVVVSGPPGSGKTTLAHELARAIPCPAICRDEIKEGMVHAATDFTPGPGDELTARTLPVFFAAIRLLVENKVTVVAEAAFQDRVWRPRLDAFRGMATLVVVQCHVDPASAHRRIAARGSRAAHADDRIIAGPPPSDAVADADGFRRLTLAVPSIDVDTGAGYQPSIDRIVAFVNDARHLGERDPPTTT